MRACGCGCLWSPRRVAGRLSLSLKTAAIYSFIFHAHISKLQYSVVRRLAAMDGHAVWFVRHSLQKYFRRGNGNAP